MHPVDSRAKRSWFFTAMGAIALAGVLVGFGRTYAAPMYAGSFRAPIGVHVHGAFAFAWILLFIVQPLLVRWRRVRVHRTVGWISLAIALGVAVTMIPAGLFQVERDVRAGAGETGISTILGIFTSGLLFLALVAAGVATRRNRDAHARWMLLATLVVVWPAWFRWRHFFPSAPRPDVLFGLVLSDLWIVVAMIRDRVVRGSVHPVLLWGGSAIIAYQTFETFAFDSAWWRVVAQAVYRVIGP